MDFSVKTGAVQAEKIVIDLVCWRCPALRGASPSSVGCGESTALIAPFHSAHPILDRKKPPHMCSYQKMEEKFVFRPRLNRFVWWEFFSVFLSWKLVLSAQCGISKQGFSESCVFLWFCKSCIMHMTCDLSVCNVPVSVLWGWTHWGCFLSWFGFVKQHIYTFKCKHHRCSVWL